MGGALSFQARKWVQTFMRYFANSDYLAGMLAMSAMGVARDGAAQLCLSLFTWAVKFLWVSVRLEEKDAELVLAWLRERPEVHASTQLTLYSRATMQAARVYEYEPEIQTTTRLRCSVKGHRAQWIWITRRESRESGDRRQPVATVSFFGRNKALLEAILESGREIQRRRMEKYLTVVQVYDYKKEHGLNWLHPQDKDRKQPGRSISSVVLPRCPSMGLCQAEALLEDAREFLDSELWYTERGIPYRRGYLLHGIPGGGKSSLIMAVASELMLPIYMLQLSSEQMSDETLNSLLQHGMHDPPSILLLEDVDLLHAAVLHRRSNDAKERAEEEEEEQSDDASKGGKTGKNAKPRAGRKGRLTLSGLLNALDGPTATTGRLLFMTTNARDRLDPALRRSGRIDYELEFTSAGREQTERLFERFYQDFGTRSKASTAVVDVEGGTGAEQEVAARSSVSGVLAAQGQSLSTKELAAAFAKHLEESGVQLTTADIQRHLMKRKTDPQRALAELPALLESQKPKGEQRKTVDTSDQKKAADASEFENGDGHAASSSRAKDQSETQG